MSTAEILRRLRLFLLLLSGMLFAGTILELFLVDHHQDAIQWLAFAFAGLGLLVTLAVLARRGRTTVTLLRWSMLLVMVGSLFGIYEHVSNNIAFEREIQPNATLNRLLWKGVAGANPLLAPGALAIAALLALAATYKYGITNGNEARIISHKEAQEA
jgi:fatty acid desaturase